MNIKSYPTSNREFGAIYKKESTTFNVWAPNKEQIDVAVYADARHLHRTLHKMEKCADGTFTATVDGDLHGQFYTYIIDCEVEVTDPYCVSANANGIRSAIVDLSRTHPEGWENHPRPKLKSHTDAILYELHVRDFTGDISSGAKYKGKFLGLTESGTSYEDVSTGLDHLVDLGITHVHLLPVYDFLSVDETSDHEDNYNWGYDPEHFNAPEGSFATNPHDPVSRIKELKQAIQALHEKGIQVILDVVYNHTFRTFDSNFNTLVPYYYHRTTKDLIFSNGSGCGNEFASDHPMGRKFIVDSLCYWAKEFKVDGFRFDLMALIDQETVSVFQKELKKIDPNLLIYGEPWIGGLSVLPENKRVYKGAQYNKGYAVFNDDFRDAIKGDNDGTGTGYIHNNQDEKHGTMVGLTGAIDYSDTLKGFAAKPSESINYFNSHDNLILYDKLRKASPHASEDDFYRLNQMAFNLIMTAQGIPFFHAGNEFFRHKHGHHNTYNASMKINGIKWEQKANHLEFYKYVKDLIKLRKSLPCLRLDSDVEVRKSLSFYEDETDSFYGNIAYTIRQPKNADFDCLLVVHNPANIDITLSIHKIVKHVCKDFLDLSEKQIEDHIEVHQIFDQRGLLEPKVFIEPHHHHFVKVERISSAIFTFKQI